ncbi:MAG TPA: hypothetical protein VK875_00120 [Euzebyales bacterium]|nr:hypothetical protein [Euzebyales bacterium]
MPAHPGSLMCGERDRDGRLPRTPRAAAGLPVVPMREVRDLLIPDG